MLLGLRLLATIILYTFLGVAFYIIWRELKQSEFRQVIAPETGDRLRVVNTTGALPFRVGQALPLQPVTLIGRGTESTIVVSDPSVAPQHVRLYRQNEGWWLESLDNRNGVKLNAAPLLTSTRLTHGDLIEVGGVCFRLETGSDA